MINIYLKDSYIKEIQTKVEGIKTVKGKPALCFQENIFYPGGGGQPYDKGKIQFENEEIIPISRTLKLEGKIFANLSINTEINLGEIVKSTIDWDRRYHFMRYHTAAHVLMGAISRSLINYMPEGIEIAEDHSSCIVHFSGIWDATLKIAQQIFEKVNTVINENRKVEFKEYQNLSEVLNIYPSIYRGPKNLEGPFRLVIVNDWDANPCGGTHVHSLIEVGYLKINLFGTNYMSFSLD